MNEEKIKQDAAKIEPVCRTLDEIIDLLAKHKKWGSNVYVNFNGKPLYSLLDDADSCYKKVTGMDKVGFEKAMDEERRMWQERKRKEKEKAREMIPEWIERGKKLIEPEKFSEWEKCVEIRARDIYNGKDLEDALEIMKLLDEGGALKEAWNILDKREHSASSYAIIESIIATFSKRGKEFLDFGRKNLVDNDLISKV